MTSGRLPGVGASPSTSAADEVTSDALPVENHPVDHLVIAVATYRRPADILRCLTSLHAELERFRAGDQRYDVRIVVVDNDADGSARDTVAAAGVPHVHYVLESRPGISAARNRALDEAGDADLLIFIDDDEEVVAGWLGHLLRTYARSRPAAVAGRVVSAFAQPLDPWIEAGGFFTRRSLPTGTPIAMAATNNLLLDLRAVRRWGLRFEDRFGLTGGGDTYFTRRLVQLGGQLVWCDDAVVVDHVPQDRATRAWVTARARRTGNSDVVVGLRLAPTRSARTAVRARSLARGSIRLAGGGGEVLLGRVTGSVRLHARGTKAVHRGRGMLGGALGRTVGEYHRSGSVTSTVRVLASFPEPGPQTNPYIAQLARALDAEPDVELLRFRWRTALIGRYDVAHLHWPEIMIAGRTPIREGMRQVLFAALVLRWLLTGLPIVRTMHNRTPHAQLTARQRFLLRRLDRLVVARIALNALDAEHENAVDIPHGHYIDWFDAVALPHPEPDRIVFAGTIKAYKNVQGLIGAFREVAREGARLHVVGRPAESGIASALRAAAEGDARVSLALDFHPDAELAREIGRAQLVVLPYRDMHNSGAVLLALSLGRPVLVPDAPVNRSLAAEVGPEWVQAYVEPLDADDLERALDAVRALPHGARPDLSARGWTAAGADHVRVYRRAVAQRHRRVRPVRRASS